MNADRVAQLSQRISELPYARFMGVRLVYMDVGVCELAVDARPELMRTASIFTGGVITSLSDMAAGYAVASTGPYGDYYVTTDLHTTFLKKAGGERLHARAEVVKKGSSISVVQVTVTSHSAGKIHTSAIATISFMKIRQ